MILPKKSYSYDIIVYSFPVCVAILLPICSDKKLLFQELADLFAVDDNHRISRDLLTRVGSII